MIFTLLSSMLLLVGCQSDTSSFSFTDYVTVMVKENENCQSGKSDYSILRGQDLQIPLTIAENYQFVSCNYDGDYSLSGNEGEIQLTLKKVRYDTRISFDVVSMNTGIEYHLCGGEYLDGVSLSNKKEDYFIEYFDEPNRVRHNTLLGERYITKKGNILSGWNTKEDYSGDHIGLGSRVTPVEKNLLHLYAEWIPYNISLFIFQDNTFTTTDSNLDFDASNDVMISGYQGEKTVPALAIPSYDGNGHLVSRINYGVFENMTIDKLYLSYEMYEIANAAFKGCTINEIYLYDNLGNINDNCINTRIKHLHINAYQDPKYLLYSDHPYFAEDMDRLMLHKDEKKLVMFAGCSLSYGMNSERVAKEFPDYFICNTGVIGGTNADFQLQIISKYLNKGDVFLHAPEEMSEFQLMDDYTIDPRVFICVEANYDLLAMVDVSQYPNLFEQFAVYTIEKKKFESCSYSDINPNYNAYGDFIKPRVHEKFNHDLERIFALDCQNETSYQRLNAYYDDFSSHGVDVCFSFAPLDKDSISEDDFVKGIPGQFEDNCRNNYHATVISKLDDYIYADSYFYNTDYHLTSDGAEIRTTNVIYDLKQHFGENR